MLQIGMAFGMQNLSEVGVYHIDRNSPLMSEAGTLLAPSCANVKLRRAVNFQCHRT